MNDNQTVIKKRGGERERAGRPPRPIKKVDYGSRRVCGKCRRFVSLTHDHRCGEPSPRKRLVAPPPAPVVKVVYVLACDLPSMPPDLE